jgi:hypothetical protein
MGEIEETDEIDENEETEETEEMDEIEGKDETDESEETDDQITIEKELEIQIQIQTENEMENEQVVQIIQSDLEVNEAQQIEEQVERGLLTEDQELVVTKKQHMINFENMYELECELMINFEQQ